MRAGVADVDADGTDDIILSCGSGDFTAWIVRDGAYHASMVIA